MTEIEIERLENAARRVFGNETPDEEETSLDGHTWFGRALTDFWSGRQQVYKAANAPADS